MQQAAPSPARPDEDDDLQAWIEPELPPTLTALVTEIHRLMGEGKLEEAKHLTAEFIEDCIDKVLIDERSRESAGPTVPLADVMAKYGVEG